MLGLENAINRVIDRANLVSGDIDIYYYMYQYKSIRELDEKEFDKVYDTISKALGFQC